MLNSHTQSRLVGAATVGAALLAPCTAALLRATTGALGSIVGESDRASLVGSDGPRRGSEVGSRIDKLARGSEEVAPVGRVRYSERPSL